MKNLGIKNLSWIQDPDPDMNLDPWRYLYFCVVDHDLVLILLLLFPKIPLAQKPDTDMDPDFVYKTSISINL